MVPPWALSAQSGTWESLGSSNPFGRSESGLSSGASRTCPSPLRGGLEGGPEWFTCAVPVPLERRCPGEAGGVWGQPGPGNIVVLPSGTRVTVRVAQQLLHRDPGVSSAAHI